MFSFVSTIFLKSCFLYFNSKFFVRVFGISHNLGVNKLLVQPWNAFKFNSSCRTRHIDRFKTFLALLSISSVGKEGYDKLMYTHSIDKFGYTYEPRTFSPLSVIHNSI